MEVIYEIWETDEHGVFLKINDSDVGDEFDDYLNEEVYALSDHSEQDGCMEFSFGRAASVSKVQQLIKEFKEKKEANERKGFGS